jgi:hypothetical protein
MKSMRRWRPYGGDAYWAIDVWCEDGEQFACFAAEAPTYSEAVAAVVAELTEAVVGLASSRYTRERDDRCVEARGPA